MAASGVVPRRGGGGRGRQHFAGRSHPPKTGERRAQRGAVAVLDLCRPRIRRSARIRDRGRVGAVSSAEANVSNEASTVITMYRQTVGMPVPEQTQMRELLRKYAKAVEGPEWENAIRAGSGTESARDALNEMYRVLGSEQSSVATSPISQKFLDQLTTLASQRNQRIVDAKPRIPGLLWTGLLFGGVVLLGLGGFMRLGSVRAHLGLLSAVAVLLGLLLFIVFWLDHPFGNELGVTSEPFEQSLSVFDSIDRGT